MFLSKFRLVLFCLWWVKGGSGWGTCKAPDLLKSVSCLSLHTQQINTGKVKNGWKIRNLNFTRLKLCPSPNPQTRPLVMDPGCSWKQWKAKTYFSVIFIYHVLFRKTKYCAKNLHWNTFGKNYSSWQILDVVSVWVQKQSLKTCILTKTKQHTSAGYIFF